MNTGVLDDITTTYIRCAGRYVGGKRIFHVSENSHPLFTEGRTNVFSAGREFKKIFLKYNRTLSIISRFIRNI